MADIQTLCPGLELGDDGIWYSADVPSVSYPTHGNDACLAIEDGSFWFRHRNNCIVSVVEAFPPDGNGTIFDIGGGNGFVSMGLAGAGFEVAIVEPGKAGAANARKRGVKDVICATADTAHFKPQSLPAVGLFDVIEHVEDDSAFLGAIRRLMKPNGRLYATVPAYSFLWSAEDVEAGHYRRYTRASIGSVLESAGFRVEFSSHIFRLLPLPILLMRTLPHRLGLAKSARKADAGSRDHAVDGGIAVRVMNALLETEVENLKNRKPMAFGGSCLLVARNPA